MQLIDSRFGLATRVRLEFHRYKNGQLAIELIEEKSGEPWTTATSAVEQQIPPDCVAVKNWTENEGIDQLLIHAGVISEGPVMHVGSGFVRIPIHRLTPQGLELATNAH